MKKYSIYLILLSIVCFFSCEDPKEDPLAEKKALISITWKISKVLIDAEEDQFSDYSAYRITFNSDLSYSRINESSASDNGIWEFNTEGNTVTLNESEVLEIVSLNQNSLVFKFSKETSKLGPAEFQYELVKE